MATLKDVAKLAGVAPITVSRVVNDPQTVKPATRDKVQAAIEALKYTPNQIARSLVTSRTNMIGIVLSNIANPYFTKFVLGVETTARKAGKSVILCNSTDDDSARAYVKLLLEQRVDGMIFTSFEFHSIERQAKLIGELEKLGDRGSSSVPIVLVDPYPKATRLPAIHIDNYMAAIEAMDHLHELGHANVGFVGLRGDVGVWFERHQAYRDAQSRRGMPLNPAHIALIDREDADAAEEAASRMLRAEPRPTAIFAANDLLAVGALQAAHRMGIRIPKELSIVGIDGNDIARLSYPRLTTVEHPRYRLGEMAADMLLGMMNGEPNPASLIVKCTLQPSESTAPPG